MPRANRYFLPDHIWHITHRCHQREFLLRFAQDRRCWMRWLFEAKKRFGLRVLNYAVTSNHIHLLVQDRGEGEIAQSLQLVAGRTAQAFNRRKGRKGAFWEDRYHATAVDTEMYLARCLTYVDLNVVRAGIVTHPRDWEYGGYVEIQQPPKRYTIIDLPALTTLLGMESLSQLQRAHAEWIDEALRAPDLQRRDSSWSESLAVGHRHFVEGVQAALGIKAKYRDISEAGAAHILHEPTKTYVAHLDE